MSKTFYKTDDIKNAILNNKIIYRIINKKYYRNMDLKYKNLLVVNNYQLDNIQRQICYNEDKYVMVIAGAGSGKTTTMIGKTIFLTKVKKINPKEILVISFTNESVNSFKNSLKINNLNGINVTTFHKLALTYLNKPNITDDSFLEYIIKEYLYLNEFTYKKNIILKALGEKQYSNFKNKNTLQYLKKIIMLIHCSNYKLNDFKKIKNLILKKPFWKRCSLLCHLYIIMDLYYLYEEEKNAVLVNDFDDLIIKASCNVKNSNYKYIIVDEYQDTSLIRVSFLKSLVNANNSKLIVVGDDYQSIYRFNGCDVNIFLNFKKYFLNPKVFKLKNTYRNSKELITISNQFILKNPYQMRKKLTSNKHLKTPIYIVYYNNKNKQKILKKLLIHIKKHYGNFLILGRNNYDIIEFDEYTSNYLTVHKSKGLEADSVVIINLENKEYGFPNLVKTNEFEKLLTSKQHIYPYDEERRLFYVALTRTKNYVFLFVNKNNPSMFIEELICDYHIPTLSI